MITHTPNGRRLINCPPGIDPEAFARFAAAMRQRESGDRYHITNPHGYLGAYQFGRARLADYGFTKRLASSAGGYENDEFSWVPPWYEARLLANDSLQDRLFARHVADHLTWIKRRRLVRKVGEQVSALFVSPFNGRSLIDPADDVTITLSGMVAVLHLVGYGGLDDLVRGKRDRVDGNGTSASDYLREFGGLF